jgi:NitT/TauT family transport system ATP-binding protein
MYFMENLIDRKYVIELFNVYQQYGERVILNDISLRIRKGEFVSIVGPTGCGKSTMLRMILGSETPSQGIAAMDGNIIKHPDRRRGIVFQKYSLFDFMNVRDNVMFGLELEHFNMTDNYLRKIVPFLYRKKMKKFREEADHFLDKVGLLEHAYHFPHELSGGQRQRVAIAQAMIMKPQILLMDEPLGALDAGTREAMQVFIQELWGQTEQTILFITHDLEEAIFMGTRLIVLSQYYRNGGQNGSKIVEDIKIPWPQPRPTTIKHTKEFNDIMEGIRHIGLDPTQLKDITEFNIQHEDAIYTVRKFGEK